MSVHEVLFHLETRVGYVYKRRKEDVEEEGCEQPPWPGGMPCSTANQAPLILSVSYISTVLHCIPIVGVEKGRPTKTRPKEKPEKTSRVPGTVLRTTGPMPVSSR